MTKSELVDYIYKASKKRNLSKALINELCDYLFDELGKGIKRDKRFTYPDFGTWTLKNRKARVGRNPQTGEEIKIPASKTVTFKPSPCFKKHL